jgi:ATP phosphoribosyltransferase-like protein
MAGVPPLHLQNGLQSIAALGALGRHINATAESSSFGIVPEFFIDRNAGDQVVCGAGFTAILLARHNGVWLSGSLQARGKRYMMMNAPASAVPRLKTIIPSLKSPTVVPLAEEGMVALHSVIAEDVFWDVMEKLKKAGASDIIVVPIETIIQ